MYGVIGTDGVVYGPVPVAALFEWIAQGRVVPTTVLIDWQGRHVPASMVPELQGAFPIQSQPYSSPYSQPLSYGPPLKKKSTALALAFFLGIFGSHRFYLGHRGSGFAMLALNLSAFLFISDAQMAITIEIVATIWLMIDMGLIAGGKLVEAGGRPLG